MINHLLLLVVVEPATWTWVALGLDKDLGDLELPDGDWMSSDWQVLRDVKKRLIRESRVLQSRALRARWFHKIIPAVMTQAKYQVIIRRRAIILLQERARTRHGPHPFDPVQLGTALPDRSRSKRVTVCNVDLGK